MGIINNEDSYSYSPYIEQYYDQQVENSLLSTDDESDNRPAHAKKVNKSRRVKHHISVSQENLASYGHKRGIRRSRRIDNLKYLINLEEKDQDVDDSRASLTFESSGSLFTELLSNPEKMGAWNDFIESSEEDQTKILNYRGLYDIREDEEEIEDIDLGDIQLQTKTAEDDWVMILDKRSDHPAYSPKECYHRVDRSVRALLKRRQLPMGILANIERELVTFFCQDPTAIYESLISSSYERLLLHALCQYLKLHSKSYDDDSGVRKTYVQNKVADFKPPSLLLSEYLQRNQHSL